MAGIEPCTADSAKTGLSSLFPPLCVERARGVATWRSYPDPVLWLAPVNFPVYSPDYVPLYLGSGLKQGVWKKWEGRRRQLVRRRQRA